MRGVDSGIEPARPRRVCARAVPSSAANRASKGSVALGVKDELALPRNSRSTLTRFSDTSSDGSPIKRISTLRPDRRP